MEFYEGQVLNYTKDSVLEIPFYAKVKIEVRGGNGGKGDSQGVESIAMGGEFVIYKSKFSMHTGKNGTRADNKMFGGGGGGSSAVLINDQLAIQSKGGNGGRGYTGGGSSSGHQKAGVGGSGYLKGGNGSRSHGGFGGSGGGVDRIYLDGVLSYSNISAQSIRITILKIYKAKIMVSSNGIFYFYEDGNWKNIEIPTNENEKALIIKEKGIVDISTINHELLEQVNNNEAKLHVVKIIYEN